MRDKDSHKIIVTKYFRGKFKKINRLCHIGAIYRILLTYWQNNTKMAIWHIQAIWHT